jgi:hypothetical protein
MGNNMKIATKHKPKKLVSIVKERGDESFCMFFDTTIEDNFKLLPDVESHGYKISHNSAIMLSGLVCVDPHTDFSVGDLDTKHAIFGLLSGGKNLRLLVRGERGWNITRMSPGDWVIFEDGKEHMVLADTAWSGIAIQVKKVNENLTGDCNE